MDQTQLRPHRYGIREFRGDIDMAHPSHFQRTRDFERPTKQEQLAPIVLVIAAEEASRENVRDYTHLSIAQLALAIDKAFDDGKEALGAALGILKRDKLLGA